MIFNSSNNTVESNHLKLTIRLVIAAVAVCCFNANANAQTEKSTPQGKVISADFMKEFSDDFEVFSVGPGVNSEFNGYNPVMSHDGLYMLYTSRSDSIKGRKTDADDGEY